MTRSKEHHFHRFLQIRNQFAHVGGKLHLTVNVTRTETDESVDVVEQFRLESLDQNGLLKRADYCSSLQEFDSHYEELRRVLHAIRDLPA